MQITTTLTAPGERVVKVDGNYAGLITREPEGWTWTGDRKAFRSFTGAAHHVAHHPRSSYTVPASACPRCYVY